MKEGAKLSEAANELVQAAAKGGKKVDGNKLETIIMTHAAAAAVEGMHCKIRVLYANSDAFMAMHIGRPQVVAMHVQIGKYLGIEMLHEYLWDDIVNKAVNGLERKLAGRLLGHMFKMETSGQAAVASGQVNYELAYTAGVIWLKVLTGIYQEGRDPGKVSQKQMDTRFKDTVKSVNIKEIVLEAKSDFKQMNKDGSLNELAKKV